MEEEFKIPKVKKEDKSQSAWEEAGEMGIDIAKSLANEYLLDFGDEALAGVIATYVSAKEGSDWKKVYREAQKNIEEDVEKSRARSPWSTFIAGLVTPTVLSKFSLASKLGEGTLDILKGMGKGGQQLTRTAIEGFFASTGRSSGKKSIDQNLLDGAMGAGISTGVHSLMKVGGHVAEYFALGDRAKAAADTLGAYLTEKQKYAGKSKNVGRTTWESTKRIYNKMFKNKLVTHTNVDWDPHLGQFIPKKGYKVKAPNISDIERNINTAIKGSGKAADEILKEAGKGEVGTPGIVQLDIAQIFKNVKAKINDEYRGEDRTDAIKVINEMTHKGRDLIKQQGNSIELLNDLRKEMDKKIRNSFGDRGEAETAINRDVNKWISGELRGAVKGKIKDPATSKKLEMMLDDMEDFHEVRHDVRLRGEIKAKGSTVPEIYASKPGMIRTALAEVRERAGVPYHITKETPSGSSAIALPRLNLKKTKDVKHFGAEYEPGQPTSYIRPPEEYAPLLKSVPREAMADMPSRIGRASSKVVDMGTQEEERELPPLGEMDRGPQQAFQAPGTEETDQMINQAMQANRMEVQQQKRQKQMLDSLRMAKLPRNSAEFIANKELILAKFAQDAPVELANISHIISYEPDKIEDAMTLYSMQYPNLFVNDQYKRINGKIIDNVAKNRARKETFDREDIPTSEKATIIDRINKTGEFTADIDTANKIKAERETNGGLSMSDIMNKMKKGQPVQAPITPIAPPEEKVVPLKPKTKEEIPRQTVEMPALDVFV